MRFLITGASGWVGFSIAHRLAKLYGKKNIQLILKPKGSHEKESKRHAALVKEGFDIILSNLLKDSLEVKHVKPFDVLFHIAAFTEVEVKSPDMRVNDIGTEKMLNALGPLLKNRRVVYTGSILSIDRDKPSNTPLDENSPCSPRTVYGITKLNGEHILKKYSRIFGFEWVILRLPTVYGPGFRPGGMFGVIPKGLQKNSLVTRLPWPGRLSIVHLDDTVNALVFLGTKKSKLNEIYHIDSGENPTFDYMINQIAKIAKIKRNPVKAPDFFWNMIKFIAWFPGLMHLLPFKIRIVLWRASLLVIDGLVFDSTKLNKILPFKYTPLDDALPATYNIKDKTK